MGAVDVGTAEFFQRGIVRGEHSGQVADVFASLFGKADPAVLQVVGRGAHLGSAAAGGHVGGAGGDGRGDGIVASLG